MLLGNTPLKTSGEQRTESFQTHYVVPSHPQVFHASKNDITVIKNADWWELPCSSETGSEVKTATVSDSLAGNATPWIWALTELFFLICAWKKRRLWVNDDVLWRSLMFSWTWTPSFTGMFSSRYDCRALQGSLQEDLHGWLIKNCICNNRNFLMESGRI